MPVSTAVRVTFAPGTTAPLLSCTVPRMSPVMDCGKPGRAISSNETRPHERITALARVFHIEVTSFAVLNKAFLVAGHLPAATHGTRRKLKISYRGLQNILVTSASLGALCGPTSHIRRPPFP